MNVNSSLIVNKKVDCLANLTYNELDKLIRAHGHDSFKDLILLLIEIFESLNASYRNEEELVDANKILAETNEKLIVQYEREKYLRKELESRLFLSEELIEDQKKDYEEKIQNLEIETTRWRRISENFLDMNEEVSVHEMADDDEEEELEKVEVNDALYDADTAKLSNDSLTFNSIELDVPKINTRKPRLRASKTFGPCSSFYQLGHLLLENDANKSLEFFKKRECNLEESNDKILVSRNELDQLSKERNKYKEELSDLRETITFVETIRAYKSDLNGQSNSQFTHNSTVVSHDSFESNQYLLNNSESMIEFVEDCQSTSYFSKFVIQHDTDVNNNITTTRVATEKNPVKLFIRKIMTKFNGWSRIF